MPASDSAPPPDASSAAPPVPSPTIEPPKLTGAELKKQKQAEKAARRAQTVIGKAAAVTSPIAAQSATAVKTDAGKGAKGQQKTRVNNSSSTGQQDIAIRAKKSGPSVDEPKEEDKTVEFFRHLTKTKALPAGLKSASKDVHPAVQVLGLQMSNYMICGSSARLVATLQAFKKVAKYFFCG
jgi:translation initiation factor eIF-2B subunit delta